jgi:hypothetical protein
LIDMVYLVCSDLRIPLPNRKSTPGLWRVYGLLGWFLPTIMPEEP